MRKRSRRYLIAGLLLAALPLLYLVEERLRGEWLLARYKKQLIARGEKLTIEELTPPVPEGTNVLFMDAFQAQSLLDVGGRLRGEFPGFAMPLEPGKAVVSWQRDRWFDGTMVRSGHARIPGTGGRVYTWDDYLRAAEATRERLPELRHQITNQVFHIQLDYREGMELLLPHLAAFKGACTTLCRAAIHDLHNGNLSGALENLHASARLTAQLESGPLLIDQLVRDSMGAITLQAIWEALQAEGWTDQQLAVLQGDWRSVRFTPGAANALGMEAAIACDIFPSGQHFSREILRALPTLQALDGSGLRGWRMEGFPDFIADPIEAVAPLVRLEAWRFVWAPFDEQVLMETLRELRTFGAQAFEQHKLASLTEIPESHPTLSGNPLRLKRLEDLAASDLRQLVSASLLPGLERALAKPARADAWNQVMLTAIALKRFQLKHGRWPDELATLVPEFLPEVPVDWMDGQPLRYRLRDDDTYLLYSVGSDGIDQGGSPEFIDEDAKDWMNAKDFVWPQPATPEEVAAADAEVAARAATMEPPPELDLEMMRRYGLLPPEPGGISEVPSSPVSASESSEEQPPE